MLSFLIESIKSRRALFGSATFMVVIMKACTVVPAFILGRIIDNLNNAYSSTSPSVALLLLSFCLLIFIQSIANPLQMYQLTKLVQHTIRDKSISWTKLIFSRDFEEFSSLRIGGITRSLERGITAHEKLLTFFITALFPLAIEISVISAILIYVAGWPLFLVILAASFLYLLICHWLIGWRRPHLAEANFQEDSVSTKLINTLCAGKQIKLELANETAMVPLSKSYSSYAGAAIKVAASGAILNSTKILFMGLCTAGILGWGIHDQQSASPQLTIGELVAVFSVAGGLLLSISGLAEAYRTLDQFVVDKQRLADVLALPAATETDGEGEAFLHISKLSLCMTPAADDYLHFVPSQTVAIIGASGAGKTTLLETLAGTVRSRRGDLFTDGSPLQPAQLASYLDKVRYCPQTPLFLEGSFSHAVLFGRPNVATLDADIESLGLQHIAYNREISEGAQNISGGEAKRLSVLRLFNHPGDFNLFDEPTASLDQHASHNVWSALFRKFLNRGLVCATHDIAALPRFDRIIVMQNGAIIADGPWADIIVRGPVIDVLTRLESETS